ncbi:MAG: Hpt domain-containing protein [Pedobacter sp.]|nr:MAG: Hpt domain-containing protein [Pedobacter sp.]
MINVDKNSEPLDLSYLREMSGDNPEFIIEMIDLFKSQTPIYLAELEEAVSASDWDKVAATAHKIKPTFTYVGREDAKDHMQDMEQNVREKINVPQLPQAFEEVKAFIKILDRQLDRAKAELQAKL